MTTTPDTPDPDRPDEDATSSAEGSGTGAPGAEMGISEEGSSFEPEEDPETEA